MDQDSAHMVDVSKVLMLKPFEYEIWRMKIEHYAPWDVIENGATLPNTKIIEGVITKMPITTAKEKVQRRLEVKSRSTLMMGIPNEHQLKFNSKKDAKKLLEAVENRFGFKSLNKADLDKMSMDNLYNNLKVYEPKVNGMSSSSSSTHNMVFVSSSNNKTSSTNGAANTTQAVNTDHEVSTTSTQVNAAYSANIDNLSGIVIYAFFSSQTNSPQLIHEDLQQIHPDDMKKMDLRWQMTMLTMSARSDQAEEGPNYALIAFSSLTSDQGLDEFVNKPVVENCKAMSSEEEPKVVKKYDDAPSVKEWVSDDEEDDVIENLVDHNVKVTRCDNGIEFKNREMNQFCEMKGILRQLSVARSPQQNEVAERRNKILIEAVRTILADFKLPTTFRQKQCPVTILNTIDHLGKFNGKADEGFFIGYSLNSKAFRVFNSRTRIVEENLHISFSESKLNVVGTQSKGFAGTKASDNAGQARKETEPVKNYILLPLWTADLPFSQDPKSSHDDGSNPSSDDGMKVDEDPKKKVNPHAQELESLQTISLNSLFDMITLIVNLVDNVPFEEVLVHQRLRKTLI
uniref:Integrase catalytic domain-containing protein n=1 Tax=Tanacetum cinerariifolium TaxID=118510 RepID=A0A6L2ME45_TANCI|nr:hypothetical protein [Tanacetum cinerariifolium]